MAGAGVVSTSSGVPVILLRSSPAWNGRCWNDRFSGQTAERYRLRSSPAWNGRCWAPAARVAVWTQDGLRSSPTWNGRCWRDGEAPGVRLGEEVAILTDLEWPVLVCVHTCGVSPPI